MADFENVGEVAGAGLSPDERMAITAQTLTELSTEINNGDRDMMPYDIFEGWALGNRIPTVELGLVQPSDTTEDGVNVYMWRRAADDLTEEWQNKLHIPGVIVLGRPDQPKSGVETDLSGIIERVIGEADGGLDMLAKPIAYGGPVVRMGARGPDMTNRLIIPVAGKPTKGSFFDVDTMLRWPNNEELLETHDVAIAGIRSAAYQLGLIHKPSVFRRTVRKLGLGQVLRTSRITYS